MATLAEPAPVTATLEELVQQVLDKVAGLDPDRLATQVSDTTVQQLLTVAVQLYASKLEDEVVLFPFTGDDVLTPTEVGMTVGHMIKAADIDLFELVSWQSLRGN